LSADGGRSERSWAVGLICSIVIFAGLGGLAVVNGAYGLTLLFGVPFIAGFVLGRWVGTPVVIQIFGAAVILISLVAAAVTAQIADVLCGVIFALVAALPLWLGILTGSIFLKRTKPGTSIASVALVALLIPLEQATLPAQGAETVTTTRVVDVDRHELFSRIVFFEDVKAARPTLLRIALPRPIRTEGPDRVGSVRRCVYDTGYILKRITAIEPDARYAFTVVKQVHVDDGVVRLLRGSFDLRSLSRHRTQITLRTVYAPKLSARVVWRPFEHVAIRRLHDYVIRSMVAHTRPA
jgi:hypothetical protein